MKALIPQEVIERKIYLIRGQKVMLDSDLADLYGVTTCNLKRQVRRNIKRFPQEFMFKLTKTERDELVPNWHQFIKSHCLKILRVLPLPHLLLYRALSYILRVPPTGSNNPTPKRPITTKGSVASPVKFSFKLLKYLP